VVAYARDVFAARTLKRNTVDMYETALRRIEREPLGSMEVQIVGPTDIRKLFAAVTKSRANVKAVLDMTFTAAKREGLIRISPMEGANIKLPKRRQKNIKAMTVPEIERVAKAATNPMYGNPLTDQPLSWNLARASVAAGLPRATFHDLRHAYATNLALGGLPMPVLQRVMGWSSIRMTDTYAHIVAEDVDAAAAITTRQRATIREDAS
jgi:site-specific recombinase XerD